MNEENVKKLRTEFISKITRSYLKKEDIYYFTTQNSNTKANIAERFIQTFKNRMYRYFTENKTHRYIDVLPHIVQSYKATPHKSLNNVSPKDVNKTNEADIWAHMYLKPKKSKTTAKPKKTTKPVKSPTKQKKTTSEDIISKHGNT